MARPGSTHTFDTPLDRPDSPDQLMVQVTYTINPPDGQTVTWHWPEVQEVYVLDDDGKKTGQMGRLTFSLYEDAIYTAAQKHMEELPSEEDLI